MMRLFLGIDGGGTGCRAALADAQGQILARAQGGPANITSDPEGALKNILALSKTVLQNAVGTAAKVTEFQHVQVAMGLAGATIPNSVSRLRAGLPFSSLRVVTDAVIALKGALQDADGIVAVIGTGSVFARQIGGDVHEIGGRGLILGDEAGGAWLGRALLADCLRAFDGFFAMTPLLQSMLDELGGPEGIISFAATARPVDFATLAPRVVGSSDPAAHQLMDRAMAEIDASIAVLQPVAPVPVVFLGGLGQSLAPDFAARWTLRSALGDGVDGALWLARQPQDMP